VAYRTELPAFFEKACCAEAAAIAASLRALSGKGLRMLMRKPFMGSFARVAWGGRALASLLLTFTRLLPEVVEAREAVEILFDDSGRGNVAAVNVDGEDAANEEEAFTLACKCGTAAFTATPLSLLSDTVL
jgi:hypothetical protein